jgi:hypothetical protein
MQRFVLRFLLFISILFLLPFSATAQQPREVRVGVVAGQLVDNNWVLNWSPQTRWQRDQIVKDINQLKPGENSPVKLVAVALTETVSSDARPEAQAKNCEYMLSVHVSYPPRFAQDALQAGNLHEPNGPAIQGIQIQGLRVIAYQLQKVNDEKLLASPWMPEWTETQFVNSVYHAIAKASVP